MQGAHALLADHCEPAGSCTGEAGTPSLQPCEELIFEDGGSAGLKLKMFQGADQHCTVGLLSKMAVDRLNSFFLSIYILTWRQQFSHHLLFCTILMTGH